MKYMGSKARFAKDLLQIILKDRTEEQYYVEPFVGGCNIIDKVKGNVSGLCVVALSRNLKLTTTLDRAITQNPCYVPLFIEL